MDSHCVVCGAYVPEGRTVCPQCEKGENMDKWTLQEEAFKRGYEKGKADAVDELVRCKDCIHNFVRYGEYEMFCGHPDGLNDCLRPDDFCSYGERREGE